MTRPSRSRLARRMRAHRDNTAFERALRAASPSMQQELIAAAARAQFNAR